MPRLPPHHPAKLPPVPPAPAGVPASAGSALTHAAVIRNSLMGVSGRRRVVTGAVGCWECEGRAITEHLRSRAAGRAGAAAASGARGGFPPPNPMATLAAGRWSRSHPRLPKASQGFMEAMRNTNKAAQQRAGPACRRAATVRSSLPRAGRGWVHQGPCNADPDDSLPK